MGGGRRRRSITQGKWKRVNGRRRGRGRRMGRMGGRKRMRRARRIGGGRRMGGERLKGGMKIGGGRRRGNEWYLIELVVSFEVSLYFSRKREAESEVRGRRLSIGGETGAIE